MTNTTTPIKLKHSNAAAQQGSQSKTSYLFCKFFIILLVLLVVPLFPTKAPEFSSVSSFFTKFWEPLQLLFVGLAVCYGLFCKRSTVNSELEIFSVNGTNEASDFYCSGILDMTSFFEDGFQSSYGYDQKRSILKSEQRYKLDEGKRVRSLNFGNGSKEEDDVTEEKITKGWNSQYFLGESAVVVENGDCAVDEWGEPLSKKEYKPLNLPVRSLRSNVVATDKYEENGTTEANFSREGPLKIRGVSPINLEKKFEEVSSPAPDSWQTRSCMMEMKDVTRRHRESSHLRPHSAGEFDFEHLKPRSSQYPLYSSGCSNSNSLGELSPTPMKMEDMDPDIDLKSSPMKLPMHRIPSEGSFVASKRVHSSSGSSLDMTLQRIKKERFNETNRGSEEENLNGEKEAGTSVNLDTKPAKISRVLLKGKSVRTIRSSKIVPYEMSGSNTGKSNAGEVHGEIQESTFLNKEEAHENRELQDQSPVPELELPETQCEDKQDLSETSSITLGDNSESKSESYPSSSDEEVARSDIEGSEVDRKAGEFIAKFREQIRLQKLALAKQHGHTYVS